MLKFLRSKYPRLSQTMENGVREVLDGWGDLRKEMREQPVREKKKRRRRKAPDRAPLGDNGFSDDDELDFAENTSSKVFGRKERSGRMGSLPGQGTPVTSRLPASHIELQGSVQIVNETEQPVLVRAWMQLPDGERWRGERMPRDDESGILGDFDRVLAPTECLEWTDPPPQLLLSFHAPGGRPAALTLAHIEGGFALHSPTPETKEDASDVVAEDASSSMPPTFKMGALVTKAAV